MTIKRYVVTGPDKMHCESCGVRVSNALKRLPGVQAVRASHETQEIEVTFDSGQTSDEGIRERLEDLGYEVAAKA